MPWSRPIRSLIVRLRRREARRRALQEFRRSLVLIVEPSALVASVANRLKELFDPDRLLICELHPRGDHFTITLASHLDDDPASRATGPAPARGEATPAEAVESLHDETLSAHGRLARWFRVNETCLRTWEQQEVVDYLDPEEQRWLARSGCQLCVPMMAKNQLIGLVLLGFDRIPSWLGRRDTDLLMELAEQASLAFQNAALYREQQERLVRLHRADRLASMGQLAAGVAHEVRNPLTAIRSTMQYLGSSMEAERKEMVRELIEEVDRIDNIIGGLLNLSRSGELQRQEMDLAEVIEQTLRLIDIRARKQNVRIEEKIDQSLPVEGDSGQMKQVFLNVLLNAMQAMDEDGGSIVIEASLDEAEPVGRRIRWVRVEVRDDGPGIPPEVLENVLDPFFTTKSEGTGLGLPICHNIVEQHGGKLELESVLGRGTTVKIQLPLAVVADPGSGILSRPKPHELPAAGSAAPESDVDPHPRPLGD